MNSDSTKIWVKVPNIAANSVDTIHINYGNSNATAMSNADSTFDFYDDFNDGVFDAQKWEIRGTFSNLSETGGTLTLNGNNNWEYIRSLINFNQAEIVETKFQQTTSTGLVFGITGTDNRFTFRMSGSNLGTTQDNNVSSSNSWWNTGYPGIIAPSTSSDSISVVASLNGNYINTNRFCNITQNVCNNTSTDLTAFTGSSFYVGYSSWSSNLIADVIRVRKYTVTEPTPSVDIEQSNASMSISTTGIDLNCNGDSSGIATTTPSNGTTPYTYQWDAGTGSQTDSSATGLASGTYYVTVTDNNGCSDIDTVSLSEPPILTLTITSNDDVNQSCAGTATAIPGGGIPAYTYQWDVNTGNQTLQTATALCVGTYFVTITDNNGCMISDSAVIGNTVGIEVTEGKTLISAYPNPSSGKITVMIISGEKQDFDVSIQDIIGKVVYSTVLGNVVGEVKFNIDISDQPAGVYILKMKSSVTYLNRKLTIE